MNGESRPVREDISCLLVPWPFLALPVLAAMSRIAALAWFVPGQPAVPFVKNKARHLGRWPGLRILVGPLGVEPSTNGL